MYGVFSVQNFWLEGVGFEGEIRQGKAVADAAQAAGVKHLVYSSVGAAHRGMGQKHFASKWIIEQHIQSLGLPYTILRPVAFMENYNWRRAEILNGVFPGFGLRPDKSLQIVATEDIGVFAGLAFSDPAQYLGKTIELAGDELTETQIAEVFTRVIGRPVQAAGAQRPSGPAPSEEQSAMFNFFNGAGYDADISWLRSIHPGLQTLEQYLRRAEWLLDNYYIAAQALREVQQDLPPYYERQLPRLQSGHPRIYDLSAEIIQTENALLNLGRVERFVEAYQEVLPLTMGELWALPTMLRLGILECLLAAVARLTELAGEAITEIAPILKPPGQLDDQLMVENSIRSLRALAVYDWKRFFETLSLVDLTLRQDPARLYAGMDFETRDRYRKAVEEIANSGQGDELASRPRCR